MYICTVAGGQDKGVLLDYHFLHWRGFQVLQSFTTIQLPIKEQFCVYTVLATQITVTEAYTTTVVVIVSMSVRGGREGRVCKHTCSLCSIWYSVSNEPTCIKEDHRLIELREFKQKMTHDRTLFSTLI